MPSGPSIEAQDLTWSLTSSQPHASTQVEYITPIGMNVDARKPSWASQDGLIAVLFAVGATAASALFVRQLVFALREQSLRAFVAVLKESAWAQATCVDYLTGAMVAATWLATRSGAVFCLPPLLWAFALPVLGNLVLYAYLTISVLRERTVRGVLVPYMSPYDAEVQGQAGGDRSQYLRYFAVSFVTISVVYFAFLLRAVITEPVMVGYHDLKTEPLLYVTFLDNLMGIAFAAGSIVVRTGFNAVSFAWVVALALCGNGCFALYAMTVVRDASRCSASLGGTWGAPTPRHTAAYV